MMWVDPLAIICHSFAVKVSIGLRTSFPESLTFGRVMILSERLPKDAATPAVGVSVVLTPVLTRNRRYLSGTTVKRTICPSVRFPAVNGVESVAPLWNVLQTRAGLYLFLASPMFGRNRCTRIRGFPATAPVPEPNAPKVMVVPVLL